MNQWIVRLIGGVAVLASKPIAGVLGWATRNLEGTVSKESEARDALDEAIARVEAFMAADDENDAAALRERTDRLNRLVPVPAAQSHLPTDARTGERVDPGTTVNDLGPAAPATSAPETSQTADEAPVSDSEQRSSDNV